MAKNKQIILKEAPLSNNCPECFNQDLKLTFFQKHSYGRLYHRTTSEVSRTLECNTCKSQIFPVQWTEDIERSVEYYEKAVQADKARIQFKPLFYILILLGIALVAALVYLFEQGYFKDLTGS